MRVLKCEMMETMILEMAEVIHVQLSQAGLEILTIHQSDRNVVME